MNYNLKKDIMMVIVAIVVLTTIEILLKELKEKPYSIISLLLEGTGYSVAAMLSIKVYYFIRFKLKKQK